MPAALKGNRAVRQAMLARRNSPGHPALRQIYFARQDRRIHLHKQMLFIRYNLDPVARLIHAIHAQQRLAFMRRLGKQLAFIRENANGNHHFPPQIQSIGSVPFSLASASTKK